MGKPRKWQSGLRRHDVGLRKTGEDAPDSPTRNRTAHRAGVHFGHHSRRTFRDQATERDMGPRSAS
jgi:hypothetical protein